LALSNPAKAGAAFFIGGVQFTIIWFLAETVYPNYSVASNHISDLGTACPATGSCYVPPAWWVFNSSEAIFGILILLGTVFFFRAYPYRAVAVMLGVAGIGLIGVGVFNESFATLHLLFSSVIFLFAALAAIVTFRLQKPPLSYVSALLGAISLIAFVLYIPGRGDFGNTLGIGPGGLERLIVYPVLVWTIGFGGHLMALED
jgi:hypothetical membrane protein